jgi:hypothetical protein
MTKDRLQDIFHSNTSSIEIDGKQEIVLLSKDFDIVYNTIIGECAEREKRIWEAFGNFCRAIGEQ